VTATAADVLEHLELDAADVDADAFDDVIAAAAGVLNDDYDLTAAESVRADRAVVMYAARLYRRRFAVNGVEAVADWGPIRVSVSDPDIHRLLARWERVRFG